MFADKVFLWLHDSLAKELERDFIILHGISGSDTKENAVEQADDDFQDSDDAFEDKWEVENTQNDNKNDVTLESTVR